jgi:hypothetical protein
MRVAERRLSRVLQGRRSAPENTDVIGAPLPRTGSSAKVQIAACFGPFADRRQMVGEVEVGLFRRTKYLHEGAGEKGVIVCQSELFDLPASPPPR